MSDTHRFDDQEIAAIFEQAAEAQEEARSHLTQGEGLTLAELQGIGAEAGISPEFIEQAATSILRKDSASRADSPNGFFGFPLTVEHAVDLPHPLSDADWDFLVADLRETFQASGKTTRDGSLREWRNGNLHAHVEPTAAGCRLRFRTRKGSAGQALTGGSAFVAIGLAFLIIRLVAGDLAVDPDSLFVGMLAAAGLGMIGFTRATLPLWAKQRSQQMEAIADRTLKRALDQKEERTSDRVGSPQLDLDALPDVQDVVEDQGRDRARA